MWTSVKNGFVVIGRQIPVGIGMGIGVSIAGVAMGGLGRLLTKGGETIKNRVDKRVDKVVAEHAPTTSTGGAAVYP